MRKEKQNTKQRERISHKDEESNEEDGVIEKEAPPRVQTSGS